MSTLFPTPYPLSAEPASVRVGRRLVADRVGEDLAPEMLDGLLLATSEALTNAIEHGAAPIELRIDATPDRVRVEVRDGSPLLPRIGHEARPDDIRGRGMSIIDRCAARWGVEELSNGKAVWFEIERDE